MALPKKAKELEPALRKRFYSPKEVAALAGVSSSTILNYIREGRLYGVKLSPRTYRIPLRSVALLLYPESVRPPRIVETRGGDAAVRAWQKRLAREHQRRPAAH